jgi:hypothetical protein
VGPPLLGMLSEELFYLCGWGHQSWWQQWQRSWPFAEGSWAPVAFYIVPQLLTVALLFRLLPWRWWVKCLAALAFVAISLAFTVYGCLCVELWNGNGI